MKRIQLVIAVETDDLSQTDDPYYSWVLKAFFPSYVVSGSVSDLVIVYKFVHMGGFGKYKSTKIKNEIRSYLNSFPKGDTYVIYCLDYDNKGNDTKNRLEEIKSYCKNQGYYFVLAYPEIEHVLANARDGQSKVEAARRFRKHYPSNDSISESDIFVPLGKVGQRVGQTNFGNVIKEIIALAKQKGK